MRGFTKEEIEAEMKRRNDAIKAEAEDRPSPAPAGDTNCIHCGTAMFAYQATDPDYPLCDNCLDD